MQCIMIERNIHGVVPWETLTYAGGAHRFASGAWAKQVGTDQSSLESHFFSSICKLDFYISISLEDVSM